MENIIIIHVGGGWHHMVRGNIRVHGQMGQANFSFSLEK
jgi:hypothetical protein